MAYFVENEYGEDVMLVTHEFSSIFHDTIFTEGYLIEGKLGPDHPGSLGMKTCKDFDKKTEAKKEEKEKRNTDERDRNSRIMKKDPRRNRKNLDTAYSAVEKSYNHAQNNKYRKDGKLRYIEGSDKDKKADQIAINHNRLANSSRATIGSQIDRHNRRHPDRKIGESSFLDIDLL